MPFYDDLSEYVYAGRHGGSTVNVGWLGRGNEFPLGEAPKGFADRLARLALHHAVTRTRGWHACPFCDGEYPIQIEVDDERHPVGDAEIRVSALDGRIYAAPTLIAHYVTAHSYRPPEEFIAAVLADDRAARPMST